MAKRNNTPFQVGDTVRRRFGDTGQVMTILWVCKGNYGRDEQLVATEEHTYCNPYSEALCYAEA